MNCSCQAPLSMGFPRQEYWCGLPFPSPGDLPDLGIESMSPALQVDSLPLSHLGSPVLASLGFGFSLPAASFCFTSCDILLFSAEYEYSILPVQAHLAIYRGSCLWNLYTSSDNRSAEKERLKYSITEAQTEENVLNHGAHA